MAQAIRHHIRAEIAAIAPFDGHEANQIAGVLDWVDSGAELCRVAKPATPPRHLAVYFALIDGDWILLADHISSGLWLPPGGHVEPGESPVETVRREIVEELGIAADFLYPGAVFLTETETVGMAAGHRDVTPWYALKGDRQQSLDFDRSEFHAVRWFPRDQLPLDRAEPNLARFVRKLVLLQA